MATVVANVAGPPQIPSGSTVDSPTFTGTRTGVTYPLAQSFAAVATPADTTEDTLATITVPANTLGANGALRIVTRWTLTNNANTKTMRVRYSGGAGTAYFQVNGTTATYYYVETIIGNRGATNSQGGNSKFVNSGGAAGLQAAAELTSAADTTGSTSVVITGQKQVAGDTLQLEGYTVEVMKP